MKIQFKIFILSLLPFINSYTQTTLLIPDTLSGKLFNLTLKNGVHQFFSGQNTNTIGANGNVLGPTLFLNKGENVKINVTNQIGDTTTLHWHGLHLSAENDGSPHNLILNNSTWSPSFKVDNFAATYWYHPHLHEKTNLHVSKGLAGFIIIRDSSESALVLPRRYGIDDFPLAIQTKDFDLSNQIVSGTNSDDIVMVNATISPELEVPAQVVRFRILNGSSQRVFNLGLTANQSFKQIATDGGLLASPIDKTRLQLAPGERAEILVDCAGMIGQSIYLKSYASEIANGIYGATNPGMGPGLTMNGYKPNSLNGADFNLLKLNIKAQTSNPITTIPSSLTTINAIPIGSANITRSLTFMPSQMGPNQLNFPFMINNAHFNMDSINYIIPFDNTEIWSLTNQSGIAHPFHIHDVQFQIIDRNGVAPPANELGWKDVVLVGAGMEVVRFITKFTDFASDTMPFMYHCHMLVHEDGGMMGQFLVKKPKASVNIVNKNSSIYYYPNPAKDEFYLSEFNGIQKIDFYSADGKLIHQIENPSSNRIVIPTSIPKGLIHLRICKEGQEIHLKLNKE